MESEKKRQMQEEYDRLRAESVYLSGEREALRKIGYPDTSDLDDLERRVQKRLRRMQRRLKRHTPETNFPMFHVYELLESDLIEHLPKEYRDCRISVSLTKENERGLSFEKSGKEILFVKMTDYETRIENREDVWSVLKSLYADCRKELLKQKKIRNQAER